MIKNIFILLFISSSTSLTAYAKDAPITKDTLYYVKLMQLNLDKNQPEKVEEIYDDKEDVLSKEWLALERLAISFERRDKLKEAVEVYRKLINNFNDKAHQLILKTPDEQITEGMYTTNKLPFYYYKLAFLNEQLYLKSNNYTPEIDKAKWKKNAEGFIALSRKVKVDNDELKILEDQLVEKVQYASRLKYTGGWYATVDVMSWQDEVFLISTGNYAKNNLLSTVTSSCFGGGRKWENVRWEFDLEGCAAFGSSTISSENKSISYEQSSVPEKAFIGGPGFYTRAISENVLLGVHIPIMYRTADWVPPNDSYRIQYKKMSAGYFLQSKFKVGGLYVRTRIGKIWPNPSSHWSVGLLYNF